MNYTAKQLRAIYNYKIVKARDCFLTFRILMNPKFKINWYVLDITNKLQQFILDLENGLKPKMIIQAPPQHGKSEAILDIIAWAVGRNPSLKTVFASFSKRLGVRANLRTQRTLSKKVYKDIFNNTTLEAAEKGSKFLKNSEILEFVNQDGYFRNTTVQGAITGESLDLGIIDDPLKGRENANSITIRNKTWDWFTDDFFTRFSEDAGFLMILTRWHIDDPAGRLIENGDIQLVTYKAIAETDEEYRKVGEALFPEHKSLEFLLERKKIMGSNFLALYQQSPIILGGNLFKTNWIKYQSETILRTIKFDRFFVTVDTALKDKEVSDYTVFSAWGVKDGKLYFLDMDRSKALSVEREIKARAFYKKWNIYPFNGMYVELKASGIDLFQRLKRDGLMVFGVERNKSKIERALNLLAYMETHDLIVNENMENVGNFMIEYEQFPNSVHDDIIDTMLDAFELTYIKFINKTIDWDKI